MPNTAHTDTLREIRALGFLDMSQRKQAAAELLSNPQRAARFANALRLPRPCGYRCNQPSARLVSEIMRRAARLAENAAPDANPNALPVCALTLA